MISATLFLGAPRAHAPFPDQRQLYTSQDSPGILSLYPTAFFVENCKNIPMTLTLDEREHRFAIEEFEPVILTLSEAEQVKRQEQLLAPKRP